MEVICKMSALELLNLLRPWDYPENFGIILKLIEKNLFFQTTKGQRGDPMKMNFWQFSNGNMNFLELGLE